MVFVGVILIWIISVLCIGCDHVASVVISRASTWVAAFLDESSPAHSFRPVLWSPPAGPAALHVASITFRMDAAVCWWIHDDPWLHECPRG